MRKNGTLVACFLVAATISTLLNAQDAAEPASTAKQDVAQLLYEVNKNLLTSQKALRNAYNTLLEAHENYIENPTSETYQALMEATQNDADTIKNYTQLVAQTKKIQAQIQQVETTYYEETPVTNAELEKNRTGGDFESELNKSEQQIVEELTPYSAFAKDLQEQAAKLKSVQDRITKEQQSKAVTTNPTAQQQDANLQEALSNAIGARLEVIFCAQNSQKTCCKRYRQHPGCPTQ